MSMLSRATGPYWDALVVRAIAAAPLIGVGLAHVFKPGQGMLPLAQALGLPGAEVLAPIAVAIEIVAGLSFLLGAWVRIGALLAIPVMLVAFYAHLVLTVWPAPNAPPFALPLVILACAGWLLWRGAGRLSLDARASR